MKKNKKRNTIMFFIILVCGITIGFALLSTTLQINGNGLIKGNTWDIHWNNVANEDGVDAQTPVIDNNKTTVTYEVNLVNPGDYYEFTVDAVNNGSLDGVINSVVTRFYDSDGETQIDLPSYMSYSVTNSDGSPIEKGQRLNHNQTKTYKVKVKYKTDITVEDLPTTVKTIISKFTVEYVQADVTVETKSFAEDSWATIADAVKNGNTSNYHVGDTKVIKMDMDDDNVDEEYTVRIANMSTPSECSRSDFSETACGFVVEFEDITIKRRMSANYTNYPPEIGSGNRGGWKYTDMRAYLNGGTYAYENINYSSNSFYNKLPNDLRNKIINTRVVSNMGYDSSSSSHELSTVIDKIYLISDYEVYHEQISSAYSSGSTRQLDYYEINNNSFDYNSPCIKKYNGEASQWWLRSTDASPSNFVTVQEVGGWPSMTVDTEYGVAPAFRIG